MQFLRATYGTIFAVFLRQNDKIIRATQGMGNTWSSCYLSRNFARLPTAEQEICKTPLVNDYGSFPPREGAKRRIRGSAKRWSPGLVKFVSAVAYYFCLALPAAFTQPGPAFFLAKLPNPVLFTTVLERAGQSPTRSAPPLHVAP